MTTESIQKPGQLVRNGRTERSDDTLTSARRDRWAHIADMFGLPLTEEQLDELPTLSDTAAADRFFPQLADVERHEVLWAADVEDDVEPCMCRAA